MPPYIQTVGDLTNNGVKMVIYAEAGVGKTHLIKTLSAPLILSTEFGLLSLRRVAPHLPCIVIRSFKEFDDMLQWAITSPDAAAYDCIAIDGISDIAEVVLAERKHANKDPRKAYGETGDVILELCRRIRATPKDFYITAKSGLIVDTDTGVSRFGPLLPGKQLSPQIPYLFDEVFQLVVNENADTGERHRWLRTQTDETFIAKDRSGVLDPWEYADLSAVLTKIKGA